MTYNIVLVPAIQQSDSAIDLQCLNHNRDPALWPAPLLPGRGTLVTITERLRTSYVTSDTVWVSLVAQSVKNLPAMQETGLDPWVGKIPWRRERQPTPVFWPGESHGEGNLAGYSPCSCKESDMIEQLTHTNTHTHTHTHTHTRHT